MLYILIKLAYTKVTECPKSDESIRKKQNIAYVSTFVPDLSASIWDERAKSDHQKYVVGIHFEKDSAAAGLRPTSKKRNLIGYLKCTFLPFSFLNSHEYSLAAE